MNTVYECTHPRVCGAYCWLCHKSLAPTYIQMWPDYERLRYHENFYDGIKTAYKRYAQKGSHNETSKKS